LKLKRLSVLLIVVLALSTIFSSIASAEKKEQPNLVALGDSITAGYHLPGQTGLQPSPNAFPSLIGERHFNVTNLGVPGWTSTNLLNALTDPRFTNSLRTADVVTLDIGNNDLLQAAGLTGGVLTSPPDPQKIADAAKQLTINLNSIITIIKTQTNAPIILYNLYNPFGANDPMFSSLHTFGEQIVIAVNTQVIAPTAVLQGTLLADAYSAFNGKQAKYIIPGDIHPNLAGHKALAKLADQALRTIKHTEKEDHGQKHSYEKENHAS
jgi:lysophospholipase L1-like esterase